MSHPFDQSLPTVLDNARSSLETFATGAIRRGDDAAAGVALVFAERLKVTALEWRAAHPEIAPALADVDDEAEAPRCRHKYEPKQDTVNGPIRVVCSKCGQEKRAGAGRPPKLATVPALPGVGS